MVMEKREAAIAELRTLLQAASETSDRLVLEIDASPIAVHAVVECMAELRRAIALLEEQNG